MLLLKSAENISFKHTVSLTIIFSLIQKFFLAPIVLLSCFCFNYSGQFPSELKFGN